MKHFAPVAPLSVARHLRKHGVLGEYHLLLAHDVLAHPEEYKEVYAPIDGKPLDIIMDNSLIELGYAMPIREVLEAAHVLGARQVVFPDTLGDYKATLAQVFEAYDQWMKLPLDLTARITPIAVVQGATVAECFECMEAYAKMNLHISIPRVLQKTLGSRAEVVSMAHSTFGFSGIHLLGFSDNLLDDVCCTRMPGVKGIDSAVPLRAAVNCMEISLDDLSFSERVGPRGDFWNTQVELLTLIRQALLLDNTTTFRQWINS